MKRELPVGIIAAAVVALILVIAVFAWRTVAPPGAESGRAVVDAEAKRLAAQGIDIKTVPRWSDTWYRYHPEYKGPKPALQMPKVNIPTPGGLPPGAPGAGGAGPVTR